VLIGLIGIIDYVILYAYFKRTSVHGTLVGTISGATPPVAGYCAVSGRFDLGALLLFLVLVFWQMAHFYAIAMFRAKDYKAAGIPVLPVVKGMRATKIQIVAYIVAFILATLLLPVYGFTGYIYSVVVVSIGLLWLRVAIIGFNAKDDIVWARKVFKYSLIALLVFSIMVSLANILP
jgi:protoheme IX farnesyltransferase